MAATNSSTPSQEYLLECFDYNPDTGVLRWKVRPREHFATDGVWISSNSQYAGCVAGTQSAGYLRVTIRRRMHQAHRVIWMMAHGKWPELFIDHINGNGIDNRLSNLREATNAENMRNCYTHRDNGTGLKGVDFNKARGKYRARITTDGVSAYLGYFSTPQEAHAAYCAVANKHHGQFANHGDKS